MSERLGAPPGEFTVLPDIETLARGERLFRIYFRGGTHPVGWDEFRDFGPTGSRFDHHTLPRRSQRRAILYATRHGEAISSALVEVFQVTRHIDRRLDDPWLAAFDLAEPLRLLSTHSNWPVQAGGNMAINSGPRGRSRQWSQAIYRSYPTIQGIAYPSSLTNEACVALYERARSALPPRPQLNIPLSHPSLSTHLLRCATGLGFTVS